MTIRRLIRKSARQLLIPLAVVAGGVMAAGPVAALEKTDVAIGTAKDPNLGAEIVIAREKGYFKKAGLNVVVKYFPSGGDLLAAVVGGSVDLGSSGSTPTSTLRGRPYPIKILAQMADISGAQQLIVKKDINGLKDLEGKRVAMLKGTASELLFDSFVKAFGFNQAKVKIVAMGPTEMLSSFIRGDVDAVNLWEPHTTRARKLGNGHILVSGTTSFVKGMEGPNRIYGDHSTLFARESIIAKNPKMVRAALRALAQAVDYIATDPGGANSILAKEFGMSEADMRGIMKKNSYTMVLDDVLVKDLNRLAAFLYSLKKVNSKLSAMDWIDPAPLKDVRPDWVKLN